MSQPTFAPAAIAAEPASATRTPQALITAYAAAAARLRAHLLGVVSRSFGQLNSWRDADADAFAGRVEPLVTAAQQAMTTLTDAYLAHLLTTLTGQSVAPAGVTLPPELRGVDLIEIYHRPFTQIWTSLSQGAPLGDAVASGRRRAVNLAATDLQLAKTHTAAAVLIGNENVVGYRRVLTGSTSCGLCVVSSTQRYHRGNLLPIHPGCDCAVAPIVGAHDPGQVINAPLLEGIHDAIAQTFGASAVDRGARAPDYRHLTIVHQHGELGPVLAVRNQRFTGPGGL